MTERVVARHRGAAPGPCLVVVAAQHGNEPAGALALRRFFAGLKAVNPAFRGDAVGLIGNLQALGRGVRFIARDLNRQWTPERMAALERRAQTGRLQDEDAEQHELLGKITDIFAAARGPIFFIDLHTFSATGTPFAVIGDTLRNRAFARCFGVPLILGLEERIGGALPEYVNNLGHVTLGFEGGRHLDRVTVDVIEAALFRALIAAGNVRQSDLPDAKRYRRILARAAKGQPRVVEIRHRHGLTPGQGFQMQPGFANFEPVEPGQALATDAQGQVRADEKGLLVMPLYQGQGDDGFFLARAIHPFWLRISTLLRVLRADHLLPRLPGVQAHPTLPHSVIIDPTIARWYVPQICHLLGYRRRQLQEGKWVFSRREHDYLGRTRNS
ncbi:MAG: succinylglutamate desuccinylase/aspartoacylase family protein [Phycisphaerae bacterium]